MAEKQKPLRKLRFHELETIAVQERVGQIKYDPKRGYATKADLIAAIEKHRKERDAE